MGIYAFPQFAGKKFPGMNFVPRPGDANNGDYGVPANFYQVQYEWMTGNVSDPWTNHWKPSIDAAHSIGMTCLRMMFEPTIFFGGASGTVTTNQFNTAVDQMIVYMASLGMCFYPCAINVYTYDGNLTHAQSIITTVCAAVSQSSYHNVVGVDLVNEIDANPGLFGQVGTLLTTARAAYVNDLPTTVSLFSSSLDPAINTGFGTLISAGVDYLDGHVYGGSGISIDATVNAFVANSGGLPCVIGESGIPFNGTFASGAAQETVHPYSSEGRRNYYDLLAAFGHRYDLQLVHNWSISPNETVTPGNDYGAFDASFVARTPLTSRMQTIPTEIASRTQSHTVDLTIPDTPTGYTSGTWFGVESRQMDASPGTWHITSNRLTAVTGALNIGEVLANDYLAASSTMTRSVKIPGSLSTPDGSGLSWGIAGRVNPGHSVGYQVILSYAPGNATFDGSIYIYAAPGGAVVASVISEQPFQFTHDHTLTASFSGLSPTAIVVTLHDDTANITRTGISTTDSTAAMQSAVYQIGMIGNHGTVFYTDIVTTSKPDPGPTMAFAPACASPAGESLPLTWAAADGGTGTVTYTPQVAAADANGFPAETWNEGTPTTSLSGTLSGLDEDTDYLVRLKAVDSAGSPKTNYSRWLAVNSGEESTGHFGTVFAGVVR